MAIGQSVPVIGPGDWGSDGGGGGPPGGGGSPPGSIGNPPFDSGGGGGGGGGGGFGRGSSFGFGGRSGAHRMPYGSTNFTAGEMTPRLFGRIDLNKYYNGASIIENFLLMKHGGLIRRSGFRHVAEVKDSSKAVRVIPFKFSVTQTYMLEFGNYYIRFFRDEGQVTLGKTVQTASNATPIVVTTTANHQYRTGMTVTIEGVLGNTAANGTWQITDLTATTFSLKDSVGNGAYTSGGSIVGITEIETPWSEADLPDLKFNQSNDVLTICHPNFTPRTLSRTGTDTVADNWELEAIDPKDGPYLELNDTAITLTPSGTTGVVTLTADAALWEESDAGSAAIIGATNVTPIVITTAADHGLATGRVVTVSGVGGNTAANGTWFVTVISDTTFSLDGSVGNGAYTANSGSLSSGNVGRVVRIGYTIADELTWGSARIRSYTSPTVVTAEVQFAFGSTIASDVWHIGAWSDTTGWPQCSIYHKDRQWFAGLTDFPQRLDASRTNNYFGFAPSNRANDNAGATFALTMTFLDNSVNAIKFLLSTARGILILTDGGPFTLVSGDPSEPIAADNFSFTRQGTRAVSSRVQPWMVDGTIMLCEAARKKLYETYFEFASDQYRYADMTLLAEHITAPGVITDMSYQEQPNSVFWCVRADGQLLTLTYERNEDVIGWTRQIIGGSFSGGQAVAESVGVIREDTIDQVWIAAKRTINGGTKRYIEFMEQEFGIGDALEDYFGVDSGLTYDGAPALVITGLEHLEGESVDVLADGVSVGPLTVTDGEIELAEAASVVHVGLGYDSLLKSMPLVPNVPGVDVQGAMKRAVEGFLLFHNTVGGQFGWHNDLETLDLHETYDNYSEDSDLFEGLHRWTVPSNHEHRAILTVKQPAPLPMTVLSLSSYVEAA